MLNDSGHPQLIAQAARSAGLDPLARRLLSGNPLSLAKRPPIDELDLPPHLRLNRLARETYFPENSGPMPLGEFAKAIQLQRESIRAQMIEERGFQARDHGVDDVLSRFLSCQRQSSLNLLGQLVTPLMLARM